MPEIPLGTGIGMEYVIDGGALLHKIPWAKKETYLTILERYFTYVETRYPKATIVFDGYDSQLSTKDTAHQRRSRMVGREVLFSEDIQRKKKSFFQTKLISPVLLKCLHHIWPSDAFTLSRRKRTRMS